MAKTSHHDERRILFLDLAETEGPLIRALIEDNNWVPIPAFSSDDVMHRIDRDRVDLVLLDLSATSVDCQAILREIRYRQRPTRFLPVLVIFPSGQGDLADPYLAAGANDVIARPIHSSLFANRLRAYLDTKSLHNRLAETVAELARDRERLIAAQSRIASSELPVLDDIRFLLRQIPCGKSGGDYEEVFPLEGEQLAVVIADVSGHGADATVHAAMLRTTLASSLRAGAGPAEALATANLILHEALGTDDLITCYAGVLEPSTGRLTHSSAGASDPVVTRAGRDGAEELHVGGGPPLGVFEKAEYEQSQTLLETGSRLFLFTNGIWQQRNPAHEPLGIERFASLIGLTAHMGLEETGDFLIHSVETYRDSADWKDDVVLLALERPEVS